MAWAVVSALLVLGLWPGRSVGAEQAEKVRAVRLPAVAGTWYPGDPAELRKTVQEYLQAAAKVDLPGRPIALICPHAGFRYSGQVAAAAYKQLDGRKYRRVIILAVSHGYGGVFRGASILKDVTHYKTPLGLIPLDREACDALLREDLVTSLPAAHRREHSLEIQLPFLQCVLGEFRLVPILMGRMDEGDYARLAKAILRWVDDETLLVVSSDFTHYGRNYGYVPFSEDVPNRLRQLVDAAVKPLRLCDFDGFREHLSRTDDTICGRVPIQQLLRVLSMRGGAEGRVLAIDFSGRMTNDWSMSVTYIAMAFTQRPRQIREDQRRALLRLARRTAEHWLKTKRKLQIEDPASEGLAGVSLRNGAAFVTFTNHGRLRGCIGNLVAAGPLYKAVIDNTVNALQDPRFVWDPITPAELGDLEIEISVLTPMQEVKSLEEVVVGRDGLLVQKGPNRGLLLPQVGARYGWSRRDFLRQTCVKAGLPASAAESKDLKIWKFQAEVFSEAEVYAKTAQATQRHKG